MKTSRQFQVALLVSLSCLALASGKLGRLSKLSPMPGDTETGCPTWGCTPSGTFSLSSDIPGIEGRPVGIKWTTTISNKTQNNPALPALGCVSSQAPAIVCTTPTGYVSLNQTNGMIVWRFDKLAAPSLPLLSIFGDVIGTDGKLLVKINYDGSEEPPIVIRGAFAPMYSVMLANDNLFLMTSYVNPVLITYGTDGIPEASNMIQATVEKVNGSFYAISQPVIFGKRAYVIMQFVPDPKTSPEGRRASMGLQRLYAIDLWARMVDCIHPVWYYNLERARRTNSSASGSPCPSGHEPLAARNNGSVIVSNNTVYVSVASPLRGNLDEKACEEDEEGTLWAIRDNGDAPELVYQTFASVSALSLYDVDLGVSNRRGQRKQLRHHRRASSGQKTDKAAQAAWSKREDGGKHSPRSKRNNRRHGAKKPNSHLQDRAEALWAATSQKITGYSTTDGSVQYSVDVCKDVLKTSDPCRITSSLMVTHSDDDKHERLVFAASVVIPTSQSSRNMLGLSTTTIPYIIALDVGDAGSTRELWRVAGKAGTEFVGQITNVVWATNQKDKKNSVESLMRVDQKHFLNAAVGTSSKDWGSNALRFEPSAESADDRVILLAATAVSDTDQIAVAIGYL